MKHEYINAYPTSHVQVVETHVSLVDSWLVIDIVHNRVSFAQTKYIEEICVWASLTSQ